MTSPPVPRPLPRGNDNAARESQLRATELGFLRAASEVNRARLYADADAVLLALEIRLLTGGD